MATEIAPIDIRADARSLFEAAARRAVPLFQKANGCRSMRLLRSHERDARYWLIVEWTDVERHEEFRKTPAFTEWRSLVGPYFDAAPMVEHGLNIEIGF
jgi:quinol monooxygenase YgiN